MFALIDSTVCRQRPDVYLIQFSSYVIMTVHAIILTSVYLDVYNEIIGIQCWLIFDGFLHSKSSVVI